MYLVTGSLGLLTVIIFSVLYGVPKVSFTNQRNVPSSSNGVTGVKRQASSSAVQLVMPRPGASRICEEVLFCNPTIPS